LDIAQALAGNSRAILQIGSASDIVRSLLVRDSLQTKSSIFDDGAPSETGGASGLTLRSKGKGEAGVQK
jgi:hypothetical protein